MNDRNTLALLLFFILNIFGCTQADSMDNIQSLMARADQSISSAEEESLFEEIYKTAQENGVSYQIFLIDSQGAEVDAIDAGTNTGNVEKVKIVFESKAGQKAFFYRPKTLSNVFILYREG